ncbi:hypothetical protein [Nonomuraea sp. NPDC050643]|uniref:hypothetical protein n=1 Tax=Nonomuraea sp. NPDC050643 TaxID=3155660 RepID=UPI0033E86E17
MPDPIPAEAEPGTYWERAVLERFVTGGPVDIAIVRRQVAALLAEIPSRPPVGDEEEADA